MGLTIKWEAPTYIPLQKSRGGEGGRANQNKQQKMIFDSWLFPINGFYMQFAMTMRKYGQINRFAIRR
jgi:hypothetical protein